MSKIEDGGPAFPLTAMVPEYQHGEKTGNFKPSSIPGMTLRDYLAAKAMQGILAAGAMTDPKSGQVCDLPTNDYLHRIASVSVLIADAMLKARQA